MSGNAGVSGIGVTPRVAKAAGVLLMLGGFVGAAIGIGLLAAPQADLLQDQSATVVLAAGTAVVVFSVVKFVAGWLAYTTRHWYWCFVGTLFSFGVGFWLPLDVLALYMVVLSEGLFES